MIIQWSELWAFDYPGLVHPGFDQKKLVSTSLISEWVKQNKGSANKYICTLRVQFSTVQCTTNIWWKTYKYTRIRDAVHMYSLFCFPLFKKKFKGGGVPMELCCWWWNILTVYSYIFRYDKIMYKLKQKCM